MIENFVNAGFGLVLGLFTGFYFERRTARAARAQNKLLVEELDRNRLAMLGRGLTPEPRQPQQEALLRLVDSILAHVRKTQDASGRVTSSSLRVALTQNAYDILDIEAAIAVLVSEQKLSRHGNQLEINE